MTEKVQCLQKRHHCQWTLLRRRNPRASSMTWTISYHHMSQYLTRNDNFVPLKLQNLTLTIMTVPAMSSLPQTSSTSLTKASYRTQGSNWPFTGIHRRLQKIFHSIWQFFDVIFAEYAIWVLYDPPRQFATSDEFTVWVFLWKTRSRPIDVLSCSTIRLFPVFPLICVRGLWLYSEKKPWHISLRLLRLKMKEEMRPALHHRQN